MVNLTPAVQVRDTANRQRCREEWRKAEGRADKLHPWARGRHRGPVNSPRLLRGFHALLLKNLSRFSGSSWKTEADVPTGIGKGLEEPKGLRKWRGTFFDFMTSQNDSNPSYYRTCRRRGGGEKAAVTLDQARISWIQRKHGHIEVHLDKLHFVRIKDICFSKDVPGGLRSRRKPL